MTTITPVGPNLVPSVPSQRAQLSSAAKQFEAIFVRQMLSAARQANFGDELFGSEATSTFREMQDSRYADIAAETGSLGLATQIEAQLSRFLPTGQGKGA